MTEPAPSPDPCARVYLERMARKYGVRIDDLWPALEAEWARQSMPKKPRPDETE